MSASILTCLRDQPKLLSVIERVIAKMVFYLDSNKKLSIKMSSRNIALAQAHTMLLYCVTIKLIKVVSKTVKGYHQRVDNWA